MSPSVDNFRILAQCTALTIHLRRTRTPQTSNVPTYSRHPQSVPGGMADDVLQLLTSKDMLEPENGWERLPPIQSYDLSTLHNMSTPITLQMPQPQQDQRPGA